MIKYIKLYEQFNIQDIDPYGEEDWGVDNLTPILQLAKEQNKPYNQIKVLDCSNRDLTNIDGIENLINLKELYCHINRLTDLSGVENLTNLKILYCSHNELINLNIENLINLKYLYCSDNQLTNLDGIENLINLEILWCEDNNFSNEYEKYLIDYCKKKNIKYIQFM